MFCNKCGAQVNDGVRFCPNCGQDMSAQAAPRQNNGSPVYQQNPYTQAYNDVPPVSNTPPLVMGILSLVFACTFYLSFLGIIFGAIGKSKARNCLAAYGAITGKAKVGNILSTIGLILGIVLTVACVILIIALIAAGAEIFESSTPYYYY